MGSSFTGFRGKGFWCDDSLLEVWLRVLALHLGEEVYEPGWQHDLRDHWLAMSGLNIVGCIHPSLERFLTEDERIAVILHVTERSMRSLRAFGKFVPAAFLNALGFTNSFPDDLPMEWFNRIADCFTALLQGELGTDASDSPVLPATRIGQPWDELERPRYAGRGMESAGGQ